MARTIIDNDQLSFTMMCYWVFDLLVNRHHVAGDGARYKNFLEARPIHRGINFDITGQPTTPVTPVASPARPPCCVPHSAPSNAQHMPHVHVP